MPFSIREAGWSHFGFLPRPFEFQFFVSTVIWRMMMKMSNESLSLISLEAILQNKQNFYTYCLILPGPPLVLGPTQDAICDHTVLL